MEVDRAIVLGPVGPADRLGRPVPALHGAGRQIDDLAIEAEGADVDDARAWNPLGEVPGADQVAPDRLGHRPEQHRVELGRLERAVEQRRAVDLAVEVSIDRAVGLREARHQEGGLGHARDERHGLAHLGAIVDQRRRLERPLHQGHEPLLRLEARGGEVPAPLQKLAAALDRGPLAPAVTQAERQLAIDDLEREAGAARGRPLGQEALAPPGGDGRPDHRDHGEARERAQALVVGHEDVGAGVDLLRARRIVAADRGCDPLELQAGPRRVGIAMDDADDLGPIARAARAADHEAHGLARRHRKPVAITQDLQHPSFRLPTGLRP